MEEDSSAAAPEKVRVVVRIRPLNPVESARGDPTVVLAESGRAVQVMNVSDDGFFDGTAATSFKFSAVFGPGVNQEELFEACGVQRLLMSAVNGYSATVFAFGQTGSGKTYSMSGAEHVILAKNYPGADARDGVIPRSMRFLYRQLEREAQAGGVFSVRVTYLEIYNEQVRDLLNPGTGPLGVRWTRSKGFHVDAVNFTECPTLKEAMAAVKKGLQARRVASHELNKDSNRSHCMLTVHIDRQAVDEGRPIVTHGKIAFVDLAGSERLKDSKAENGLETGSINKSLFTLGKVISTLASNERRNSDALVPFRESKLTKLLIDSLGGNSMTLMIVCCSPSVTAAGESLRSLQFAARAANIRNRPRVLLDEREQLVVNLRGEIEALRRENQQLRSKLEEIMSQPFPHRVHTAGEADPPPQAPPPAPARSKPASASAVGSAPSPKGRGRGGGPSPSQSRVGGWTAPSPQALRASLEASYGVAIRGAPPAAPAAPRSGLGSLSNTAQSRATAATYSPEPPSPPPAAAPAGGLSASQRVAAARAREAALLRELDSLAGGGVPTPTLAALPEGAHGLEMEEEEERGVDEAEEEEVSPVQSPVQRRPQPYPAAYPAPPARRSDGGSVSSSIEAMKEREQALRKQLKSLGRGRSPGGPPRASGSGSGPTSPAGPGPGPAAFPPQAPPPPPPNAGPVLRAPYPSSGYPPAPTLYPPQPPVAAMPSYFQPPYPGQPLPYPSLQQPYPGGIPPSPVRAAGAGGAGKEAKRGKKGKGGGQPRRKSPARNRPQSFEEQVASLSLVTGMGGVQLVDRRGVPAAGPYPGPSAGPAPAAAPMRAPGPPRAGVPPQGPASLSVPAFLMGTSPEYLTRHERLIVDLQAARVREQQEMVEMRRKMTAWLQAAGLAPASP